VRELESTLEGKALIAVPVNFKVQEVEVT